MISKEDLKQTRLELRRKLILQKGFSVEETRQLPIEEMLKLLKRSLH